MVLGTLWLVLANAAAAVGAHALCRPLQTGRKGVDVLAFLLLRLLLISATVAAAGLLGILKAGWLGGLALAALGVLVGTGRHVGFLGRFRPLPGYAVGIGLLLFAARSVAQAWTFAPSIADALSYHLPKVAEWTRAGAFTGELGLDTHATLPAGFELIETWWVLFLHHDVFIELAGLEFLVLGSSATFALAEGLGLRPAAAWAAAGLYALTPGLHFQALACLNDGPVAALVVATAALLVGGAPWTLAAVAVGLGAGVKPSFFYGLSGLLMLLPAYRSSQVGRAPRVAVVLSALAAGVGSFWYARNWICFGDPLYPFGQDESARLWIQVGPRWGSFAANLSAWADRRWMDGAGGYGALLTEGVGWGPVAVACGSVALIGLVRDDRGFRRVASAFVVSLLCTFLTVQADPWSMRFVLFFPPLLCVAAAAVAPGRPWMQVLIGLGAMLQFAGTFRPAEIAPADLSALLRQPWRTRSSAPRYGLAFPGEARVASFGGNDLVPYLLYRPDYSRGVVYLRSSTAEALLSDMDAAGARILHAVPSGPDQQRILRECLAGSGLRPRGYSLFERLPKEPSRRPP